MAAGLVMGATGCAKDGGDGPNGAGNEGPARMGISFRLPSEAFTRVDQPADDVAKFESKINTIQAWVFQGGVAVDDVEGADTNGGGYFTFDITDFNPAGAVYTLKDAEAVVTASGDVTIFVAANTPAALNKAYDTPAELLAALATVGEMSGTGAFTMCSAAKNADLTADDGTPGSVNKVSVDLGRVVSKVQATTKPAGVAFENQWTGGPKLTYTVKGYNVHHDATSSYLVGQASTLSTPIDETIKPSTLTVHPDAAVGSTLGNLTGGVYIGENWTDGTNLKGTTTFAMIGTTVALDKVAEWNAVDNKVDWVAAPAMPAAEDDVVILTASKGGVDYTFPLIDTNNLTVESDALSAALTTAGYTVTRLTFWDGWVHFQKWLNKAGSNDYNVGRNQFIHLNITGIAQVDGKFPGFPGKDDTNPETPSDPVPDTEEDDPVDPLPAELLIEVTVKAWEYVANDVVLGE